jgi:hypothetical protein
LKYAAALRADFFEKPRRRQAEASVSFVVNSSPGAGLRYEPSATFLDAQSALGRAAKLEQRGMRLIRIKDTISGQIFDEPSLRAEIRRLERGV